MLRHYFQIIRKALLEGRVKGQVYYEAHHIIPKSFNKKSNVVLLTPEEHYECHKILADELGKHPIYGQKMLWAFHRLAYDKQRKLTAEEYAIARKLLMPLWTRKKSEEHKLKISEAQKGNTNNKSRVYKGMKSSITQEGKNKLAEAQRKNRIGKIGSNATASKGEVICKYESGKIIEAENAFQLSIATGIPQSTISFRLKDKLAKFKKGYKVYYKKI